MRAPSGRTKVCSARWRLSSLHRTSWSKRTTDLRRRSLSSTDGTLDSPTSLRRLRENRTCLNRGSSSSKKQCSRCVRTSKSAREKTSSSGSKGRLSLSKERHRRDAGSRKTIMKKSSWRTLGRCPEDSTLHRRVQSGCGTNPLSIGVKTPQCDSHLRTIAQTTSKPCSTT